MAGWDGTGLAHRFVKADGIRYHLLEGGAGPLVLLVAGFPQTCYAWRRLAPLLTAHHRVVAVDLPGQGDSDKPPGGYDTATTAARVRTLLDALGEERCFFVGHDIGAWVAYPFAATYPDRLFGAALIDANIPGVTLPSSIEVGPDSWRSWHFLFNAVEDLPEALLAGRERVLIEWFFARKTANASATFDRADIDEYERAYRLPGTWRGMLGYYRAVPEDMQQNRRLAERPIAVPLLVYGGEVGSAPNLSEAMKPLGSDVRGGVIAASGHYIPEEQPSRLADALLGFFRDVGAG